jgi:hypothetical protein
MRPSSVFAAGVLLAFASLVSACGDEHAFVGGPNGLTAFAMDESTPAFITGEDGSLYLIETRVLLPIEPPTDEEAARLAGMVGPFPSRPWVERGDIELELDWTMINLEEQEIRADLAVNGINEFHEYAPGAQIVDDEVVIDFAQWERSFELEPLERRQGTIREEELDEVAVDLATVVNGAPNSHMIVFFESQSATDPRSQMYIPEVIPGLTGLKLAIRSTGCGGRACRIVVEATLRARDVNGRLASPGEMLWELPVPMMFVPLTGEEE